MEINRRAIIEAAKVVAEATAWKTVDDRKVEVNAVDWDAALLVAREVLRVNGVHIPVSSDTGEDS